MCIGFIINFSEKQDTNGKLSHQSHQHQKREEDYHWKEKYLMAAQMPIPVEAESLEVFKMSLGLSNLFSPAVGSRKL